MRFSVLFHLFCVIFLLYSVLSPLSSLLPFLFSVLEQDIIECPGPAKWQPEAETGSGNRKGN